MADFEITGGEQLAAVQARLDEAADTLQHDLTVAVEETARHHVVPAIRKGAQRLPRGGGLADKVAGQPYDVHVDELEAKVTVEVSDGMRELEQIDAGTVTHQVWDTGVDVTQQVAPGFFSEPARDSEADVHHAIETTMGVTARNVTRSV